MDKLDEYTINEIRLEAKQSKKAEKLVEILFKDIKDRFGNPYLNHLYAVANCFNDEERYTVGLLHDTLEEVPNITYNDLVYLGFRESYLNNLLLLTHNLDVDTYDEYIDKIISSSSIPVLDIKLADMKHNLSRMDNLDLETQTRLRNKYKEPYEKLIKRREELK